MNLFRQKLSFFASALLLPALLTPSLFAQAWVSEAPGDAEAASIQIAPVADGITTQSLDDDAEVSLTSNVADAVFPEIEALARSLHHDPARIFEYVFNEIETEHYYGSKRGARLTLLEGAGNDMDQASLLVALLRASGYPAGYVKHYNTVYYDSADPSVPTGRSWLGLAETAYPEGLSDPVPHNWPGTPVQWAEAKLINTFLKRRGHEAVFLIKPIPGTVLVQRTVAVVEMDGHSYYLDPSARARDIVEPIDFLSATGFEKAQFLDEVGGISEAHRVQRGGEGDGVSI